MKDSRTPEPCVGIFWLLDGKLIIDVTPLSKAEPYSTALTHSTGHIDYWARLQHTGTVPADVEYEEPPRGRVVFYEREQRFHLFADKCILSRRKVVRKIMDAMHLPPGKTSEGRDEQYQCSSCLYPAVDDDASESVVAEVYPSLWRRRFPKDGRDGDEQAAYAAAAWLQRADRSSSLSGFLSPHLTPEERQVADIEGWILGVV